MIDIVTSDRWLTVATAIVCYTGVVVYGAVLSIQGRRPGGPVPQLLLIYLGLFPLPRWSVAFEAQMALLAIAVAGFGPKVLCYQLNRFLEVRAYEQGCSSSSLGHRARIALYLPALLILAYAFTGFRLPLVAPWLDPEGRLTAIEESVRRGWIGLPILVSLYLVVAWLFGRRWLRALGRIRLLSGEAFLNWMNGIAAATAVVLIVSASLFGPTAPVTRLSVLMLLAVGLGALFVGLEPLRESVVRRVLSFHVLLALAAVVTLGGSSALTAMGLGPAAAWGCVLVLLTAGAIALPRRVDRAIARSLFPRADAMLARLASVAAAPLSEGTRAEAGAALLRQVVDAVDGEGGLLVLQPASLEPASICAIGRVDPTPLGTAGDAARYLATLPLDGPQPVEALPLADQLRLLRADVLLVCPLRGSRLEGTLLLGPRRGWAYDSWTIEGLRAVGHQAGLALENLTLATARAHADKLAALGQAAARIAHEIRNPLAAARSLVQLVGQNDGTQDLTEPAVGELDRIGRLVSDLLAFSRRDDVRAREEVDVAAVCRAALAEVAPLAQTHHVEVVSVLAPATLVGDEGRMVQAVSNLCRNAVEAAAAGWQGGRVTLSCRTANGLVAIEVRDSGPGIVAGDVARAFEPFHTTKADGTGLGLPIARGIIETHGGRLVVYRRDGETVFRVELPAMSHAGSGSPPE